MAPQFQELPEHVQTQLLGQMAQAQAAADAKKPPENLEDVVSPGDLAALVAPDDWEPLRAVRRQRDEQLDLKAHIAQKLQAVEEALGGLESRRPRDAAKMAQALLDGQPMPVEPEPAKPEGVSLLGREALAAARSGLLQKQNSAESTLAWLQRQVEDAERKILRGALEKAARRYAELIQGEVKQLHVLLDAGANLLSQRRGEPLLPPEWRREKIRGPAPFLDAKLLISPDYMGERCYLADFGSGAGIGPAQEQWRRAVKSAAGVSTL
jgi:hypothetical protein